jgi:D-methionine transport system substrate-binding protein
VPHAEILEFVKPALAKQGVDLDIKVFNDFIQPNLQLAQKNLDANYYQYRPFLNDFNKTRHTDLVPVVGVHIEPFGAYSAKYKNLAVLPDGASVASPPSATSPTTPATSKSASWRAPCWRAR